MTDHERVMNILNQMALNIAVLRLSKASLKPMTSLELQESIASEIFRICDVIQNYISEISAIVKQERAKCDIEK